MAMDKMIKQELREEDIQSEELYRSEMIVTLGQMAKGMIHEFNNPLQAIFLLDNNGVYNQVHLKIISHQELYYILNDLESLL